MNLREAAEMALEALEEQWEEHEAIDALRQALAEPANSTTNLVEPKSSSQTEQGRWVKTYCGGKPNYCTPEVTPDVDAVNISEERVDELRKGEHIKCIVKDCQNHIGQGVFVGNLCKPCHDFLNTGNGVYSQAYRNTKRKWVGLTDEEIMDRWPCETRIEFARWVEAKLKEKNGG